MRSATNKTIENMAGSRAAAASVAPGDVDFSSAGFGTIEKTTLQDRIYEELRYALIRGHFVPGDNLTIRSLASFVGTSIVPVRDALQRLTAERALVLQPNRSASVPVMTRREFDDLMKIRLRLECLAIEEAAPAVTPALVDMLAECNQNMLRAIEDRNIQMVLAENMKLHFLLYRLSDNELLLDIIEKLWVRMGPMLRMPFREKRGGPEKYKPGHFEAGYDCHEELIRALREHDTDAARAALSRDLSGTADWYHRNHTFAQESG